MKKTIIVLLGLTSLVNLNIIGQTTNDTIYYNKSWKETIKSKAAYYSLIEIKDNTYIVRDYYINGKLQMLGHYSSIEPKIKNGQFLYYDTYGNVLDEINYKNDIKDGYSISYYKNNFLFSEGNYSIGYKNGLWKYYHNNGNLEREITYNNGTVDGTCYHYDLNNKKIFKTVVEKGVDKETYYINESGIENKILNISFSKYLPKFPGGLNGLNRFLQKNVQYPQEAIDKGINGKVIIHFLVDNNGNVLYPRIYRSIHPLLDQEALRVVRMMPKWTVSVKVNKSNKCSIFLQPVNFSLN
jgi:TonB family protein